MHAVFFLPLIFSVCLSFLFALLVSETAKERCGGLAIFFAVCNGTRECSEACEDSTIVICSRTKTWPVRFSSACSTAAPNQCFSGVYTVHVFSQRLEGCIPEYI